MEVKKITLVCLSPNEMPEWVLGDTHFAEPSATGLTKALSDILATCVSDWVLIWDYSFGKPDTKLIQQLACRPVDAWHCGLRMGLAGLPDVLNYVHPTWIYNKDASPGIEHSSFRLSINACLIRTQVLKNMSQVSSQYTSLAMMGVAMGYKLMKQGAVVRYHPGLLQHQVTPLSATNEDEWTFAHEFFTPKWQVWTLLNKPNRLKNFNLWRKGNAKYKSLHPQMHASDKKPLNVQYKTVSVLAPTLNRYSYLLNELEQLSKQTIMPCEVLITDQTDEKDRMPLDFSQYPGLSVRYFPQNEKGQCIAWNKLLEEAKGEYVLFLGDDADDIKPDFIEKLLGTMQHFNCDMVASNVIELGMPPRTVNHHYYMSDTFPITLIKREVVVKAGLFDMFFNKNIRADQDLSMRCHLNGILMIFDSSATILHHRAPSGGLRTHNARVITNHISKNSITKFAIPTSSEIYLAKKYYSETQVRSYIRIKYFNQLIISGNIFRKLLRGLVFAAKLPGIARNHKVHLTAAENALAVNKKIDEGSASY